ncbi:hypothetical protein RGU70_13685 [Herbaspirillum sp. RTI4]|uniref:GNAT family N-acetyltransferase n=1 Tax=Herbaspirillum sp. RTI4 TaxID=3048640 RepID=UPI002AB58260|nr:GNAT family N-acetyltransferase [Herbaspirillum sp. RTI4]MDY7579365.1 hypothetical protein [Herbaspirillum sp. RTI4]MEA9980279.1 hypothetical protein [Herbaspirillum sp. RTI4]
MDTERIAARHSSIQIVEYSDEYRDQVIAGAHQMHADSIYADLPLDEDKVIRQLAACGNIAPDRFFRLAVRKGEVMGGFYGHYSRAFFCDELLAHDMGWWVLRDKRGTAAAVVLLAAFEVWAKERGAKKVMVGQSTAIDIGRTTKLYRHCGFRVIGFNTVKDI